MASQAIDLHQSWSWSWSWQPSSEASIFVLGQCLCLMDELPATDNTSLKCAARVFGFECADENLVFLRCKQADEDPRACLTQGEQVTACVIRVLRELERHCGDTYHAYKHALKENWHMIDETRSEQHAMEDCWRTHRGYGKKQQQ